MQLCNYATMQLCNYATMQLCNYATMQLCNYATMQLCNYATMQLCNRNRSITNRQFFSQVAFFNPLQMQITFLACRFPSQIEVQGRISCIPVELFRSVCFTTHVKKIS
jgi:hypothetical protein